MVALHAVNSQQKLPGIASLALPLPTPLCTLPSQAPAAATTPSATAASVAAPRAPTQVSLEPVGTWALAQGAGLPAAGAQPWHSSHDLALGVLREAQIGHQPAVGSTAGAPVQETSSNVLASMLRLLQQQQQQLQHEMHLQRNSALLMLHHPQLQQQDWLRCQGAASHTPEVGSTPIPPVQSSMVSLPMHVNRAGLSDHTMPASVHQSANTTCSSRSSPPTAGGATQGSPDHSHNSLSTLLACNEMLKSQLQENELRIKRCHSDSKEAAQGDADADSNDGTDSDIGSTNGASIASNASTTPSTKESSTSNSQSRYWTEEEHRKFLEAVRCFGAHNHKAIASYVTTRNSTQVRSHSQKFFKKLETFRGRGLPTMLRKRKQPSSK